MISYLHIYSTEANTHVHGQSKTNPPVITYIKQQLHV